jgi:adenosylmethionine-8-amino-7-oxononanoate aminotransferase
MAHLEAPYRVAKAYGVRLELSDGRRLIDAIASWWCAIHGYSHPELDAALREQARDFAHVMLGGLTHEPARRLAERLVDLTPPGLNHVFFADSGSVGMEVAMKMSVQYWKNVGVPGKLRFISLLRAYHGDTTGVMSLGDPHDGMHAIFRGYLPEQFFVPPPVGMGGGRGAIRRSVDESLDALRRTLEEHAHEAAAFVCEPLMQGAGGFNFYPASFLKGARELCDRHNVLLVLDEVATGFGRTGTLFATEQASVTPDILVLAKALGAGYLGISATVASDRVYEAFLSDGDATALMHGPTFMGNALACAVAEAGIDIFLRGEYLSRVRCIEEVLRDELLGFEAPCVRETRVFGAVGVIEVDDPSAHRGLTAFAADRGVWLRPFDNVAYTAPPYVIGEEDLRSVCRVLREWFTR